MPNITTQVVDDSPLYYIRRDLSGGANTRMHPSNLQETQAVILDNVDIGTAGQTSKRPGLTLIDELDATSRSMYGFQPAGGTNQLCSMNGTNLSVWAGSGTFANKKTDFSASTTPIMFRAFETGNFDVLMIGNGVDNWFRMKQDYSFEELVNAPNANKQPPKSTVGAFYRNRMWVLKSNKFYFSDAAPTSYTAAFDQTTNYYLMPVGTEMGVVGVRDSGMIVIGDQQIWSINPSTVPDATDKSEKVLDIGCVAQRTICQVADDIFFLAKDGVRGIFRTQLDKLQQGNSYALSYPLKTEFDSISWAYISKAASVYFDNKYFISLPTNGSAYNNSVWVYNLATGAWTTISGWNVSDWSVIQVGGQERLYATDSNSGNVYRAWYGATDNGTVITYKEQGKQDDLGQPLVKKYGGVVKVRAVSSGNYNIAVWASFDLADWTFLGNINLSTNAPTLPVVLPFNLVDNSVVTGTIHLDDYTPWRSMSLKLLNSDDNGSDPITIIERSVVAYAEEYSDES
jgi:hypothetical protein